MPAKPYICISGTFIKGKPLHEGEIIGLDIGVDDRTGNVDDKDLHQRLVENGRIREATEAEVAAWEDAQAAKRNPPPAADEQPPKPAKENGKGKAKGEA